MPRINQKLSRKSKKNKHKNNLPKFKKFLSRKENLLNTCSPANVNYLVTSLKWSSH